MLTKQHIKDANNKDLNHCCNIQLISTGWKHQLDKMLGMKINHLTLHKSTLDGKVMEKMLPINHGKLHREKRALLKEY